MMSIYKKRDVTKPHHFVTSLNLNYRTAPKGDRDFLLPQPF